MNELREAIFEEVYAGRNGDVYEDCYEATDRIIALVREALLSEDVIEAARQGWSAAWKHASDQACLIEATVQAATGAAGLTGGQGDE